MEFLFVNECYSEPLDLWKSSIYREKTLITREEQHLLLELIKRNRPKKIVEVGVAFGGTTALVLHCMEKLNLDSRLYSIDLSKKIAGKEPGFLARELVPEMLSKWTLFSGCTIARRIEEIAADGKIDFLILDAAHILPGEAMDFLAALPYLNKEAIVVLHDIMIPAIGYTSDWNATSVLFSSVIGEKFLLRPDVSIIDTHNIGAFRIIPDTMKYIENVFLGLHLPWQCIPDANHMADNLRLIKKNYAQNLYDRFARTYELALVRKAEHLSFNWEKFLALKKHEDSRIVIWGGGKSEGYRSEVIC